MLNFQQLVDATGYTLKQLITAVVFTGLHVLILCLIPALVKRYWATRFLEFIPSTESTEKHDLEKTSVYDSFAPVYRFYSKRNVAHDPATLAHIQHNREAALTCAARGLWWENFLNNLLGLAWMVFVWASTDIVALQVASLVWQIAFLWMSHYERWQAANHFQEPDHDYNRTMVERYGWVHTPCGRLKRQTFISGRLFFIYWGSLCAGLMSNILIPYTATLVRNTIWSPRIGIIFALLVLAEWLVPKLAAHRWSTRWKEAVVELPTSEKDVTGTSNSLTNRTEKPNTRYTTRNVAHDQAMLERIQYNRKKAVLFAKRSLWWEDAWSWLFATSVFSAMLICERNGWHLVQWICLVFQVLLLYLTYSIRYEQFNHFGEEDHRYAQHIEKDYGWANSSIGFHKARYSVFSSVLTWSLFFILATTAGVLIRRSEAGH